MIRHAISKASYFVFTLLLLGLNHLAFAVDDSPQEVVKRYYTADMNGVRLSGQTYKSIKPLVSWEHEPGWDYAFITNEVKIYNAQKISNNEVIVEVRYHIIGIWGGDSFSEYDFNEVIDFTVVHDGKKWKIKKPIFPPHISPTAAIKHLEELIRTEGAEDKSRSSNLKHTIERLKDTVK